MSFYLATTNVQKPAETNPNCMGGFGPAKED